MKLSKNGTCGTAAVGNTSNRQSAIKNWAFTLNNYTKEEHDALVKLYEDDEYLIAKEIGKDKKTPHLHGYVHLKVRKRFQSMQNALGDKRIHWERVKNVKKYLEYIQKEGQFVTNMKLPRVIIYPDFNKPWQIDILKLIETKPDDRSIYWYWSSNGNLGKTIFAKFLCDKKGCYIVPPKRADAFHAVALLLQKGKAINSVVIDVPRHDLDFINYGAIEKIKDGLFASGKYETATCIFHCPHVIVFANSPPDTYKMSEDRWKIFELS